MDNFTRKNNGQAYIADENCNKIMLENRCKVFEFNNTNPRDTQKLDEILRSIIGKAGKNITILQPFHCDYGKNIEVGDNFYANYNFIVLDVAKVTIGNNVFVAPNVSVYTAGHPVHYEMRNTMLEYGIPITIGDNCWIGGNVVICPGVNIGENTVIGAGSVVTKDIPPNVIAAGNPCRVIREITEEDKKYYYKKNKFDEEALNEVEKSI